mmetsp:Transcript_4785/g.9293  ORF Transcript_4785/g.9293 Transcript_4785/m.9293 type:complete len:442 (-) Transcript_4785:522-1847(-)
MSLDVDEKGEDPRCNDCASHKVKRLLGFQLAEAEAKSNSPKVATSTDNSSNGSGDRRVDIWHNTVSGPLCRLDDRREEDHDKNSSPKRVGVGKDEYQDALYNQKTRLPNETSTHSHSSIGLVRHESTHATSKEVHPAEDGGDGSGALGGELEFGLKVGCSGIVHGKLDSEAAGVLEEKNPCVDVGGAAAEGGRGRDLGHGTILLHFIVVPLGSIIRNPNDEKSKAKSHNRRNNAHSSPGLIRCHSKLEEREKDSSHDNLGDTTSKVTPASHERVGSTGNFLRKHTRRPELAADKRRSTKANEEAKDGERSSTIDETSACARNGTKHQKHSHQNTRSVLVAHRTIDKTHEDSPGDGANVGSPNLLLRNAQRVLNLGQKRCDGEPDEERCKEAHPRAVEGAHVRAFEGEKLDLSSFVILVGIDIDVVRVVLFDLGLARRDRSR